MLRKDVPFKTGRSRDLLKYKPFVEDFETRVIRTVNGQQVFAVPGEGNKLFDGVKYLNNNYLLVMRSMSVRDCLRNKERYGFKTQN